MQFLWTNTTRDIRRVLSARSGYSVQRISGFSLPDKDHLSARGPQQHGATYVDTFFRPRRFSLYITIAGCDAEDFQAKHVELVRAMNPLDDGELRIIAADETRYTLTCRPVREITLRRHNAIIAEALVQLVADDPFFYTAEEVTPFTSAVTTGLRIPFTIPARISSPQNEAAVAVQNGGHLLSYPIITVRGPCENPQMRYLYGDLYSLQGEQLTVSETITAHETLTVDMGARTAIITTGGGGETNVLGSVSGTWWALPRGTVAIFVTSADIGVFNGNVSFSERYLAVV